MLELNAINKDLQKEIFKDQKITLDGLLCSSLTLPILIIFYVLGTLAKTNALKVSRKKNILHWWSAYPHTESFTAHLCHTAGPGKWHSV